MTIDLEAALRLAEQADERRKFAENALASVVAKNREIEGLVERVRELQAELDAANEYARAVLNRQLPRVDAAAVEAQRLELENSRLRVMAGLLEQNCVSDGEFWLPNKKTVWCDDGLWRLSDENNVCDYDIEYPTALAAIRAGMGWDREEGG